MKPPNPSFLEKRVYQENSGKVYPHSVIDKISDIKTDKKYKHHLKKAFGDNPYCCFPNRIDDIAVSLPDLLVFEEDLNIKNKLQHFSDCNALQIIILGEPI